ncbi:hypothetical protein [Bifidobacterium sp. UTBIF-68]|uniref:hypothetical protein n=1 Tax=Bifidobacterium sp. UTBIF-68 TaxID=1465262 RepID=UPI00112E7CC8|nr:hypothetical protein [Bifidobacterium sp. UTBIF-68]
MGENHMTAYKLPDIPGHVAGKKARLTIDGNKKTVIEGVISTITVENGGYLSEATITFSSGVVTASFREKTPHVLEVEE